MDCNSECIARLSAFDINGASLRIAVRLLGFVAAIAIRANLAAKGVFGFDDYALAGRDSQARLVVAGEFVVERAEEKTLHSRRVASGADQFAHIKSWNQPVVQRQAWNPRKVTP